MPSALAPPRPGRPVVFRRLTWKPRLAPAPRTLACASSKPPLDGLRWAHRTPGARGRRRAAWAGVAIPGGQREPRATARTGPPSSGSGKPELCVQSSIPFRASPHLTRLQTWKRFPADFQAWSQFQSACSFSNFLSNHGGGGRYSIGINSNDHPFVSFNTRIKS